MNKPEHIFFDLDNTLWDFSKNSDACLKLLFNNYDLI
ncbi:MAG: FMN phosphatase YigB (HAD superfamily), partial [Limisphaerales bacterium]